MKITTPVGIAHYPYISKPDTQAVDKGYASVPMYKVNLSIPQEEAQPIVKLVKELLVAGMKSEKDKKPKANLKQAPLPFSSEVDEDGEETGNIIFKFKSKFKPAVFDSKKQPMIDHNIFGGSELKVGGLLAFYSSPAIGCGVTLRLQAVQVIQYVEGTGSGADSFDFEEEDGFVSGADQAESTESPNTQEQVDVSVNIDAAPAAKEKPKAKPKAKPVPVEEPEDVPSATTNDELAAEIAKLVGE